MEVGRLLGYCVVSWPSSLTEGDEVDYYTFLREIIRAFIDTGPTAPRQRLSSEQPAYILTASFTLFATFPVLTSFPCPNLPKRWSRIDNLKYRSRSSIVPGMMSTLRVSRVQPQVYLVFEVIRNHPVLKLQRIAKGL